MAVIKWILFRLGNIEDFKSGQTQFELDAESEKRFMVGRGRTNSIVLGSLFVSRRHCEFLILRGDLYITDLGAENGTYINDIRVAPQIKTRLKPGDVIGLGVEAYRDKESFIFEVRKKEDDANQRSTPTSTTSLTSARESPDQDDVTIVETIHNPSGHIRPAQVSELSVSIGLAPASKRHLVEVSDTTRAKVPRQEEHEDFSEPEVIEEMDCKPNSYPDNATPRERADDCALSSSTDKKPAGHQFAQNISQPISSIEVVDILSSDDEVPSSSVHATMIETKSDLVQEPIPSSSSYYHHSVKTPDNHQVVKLESPFIEKIENTGGDEEDNNAFLDDLMETRQYYDDDVIIIDDDDGCSFWQPSQIFSDTQVCRIKEELDEALSTVEEENDEFNEDVKFDCDDHDTVEISDDDDDDEDLSTWYWKLSQGGIKLEQEDIRKVIIAADENLSLPMNETVNNLSTVNYEEAPVRLHNDAEDLKDTMYTKHDIVNLPHCSHQENEPSTEHPSSDDSLILPRKSVVRRKKRRARPIESDSDDDLDSASQQSTRLILPVQKVASPIIDSNMTVELSPLRRYSIERPVPLRIPDNHSDLSEEVDFRSPAEPILKATKAVQSEEVSAKGKKIQGIKTLPRTPSLIDALPLPQRRSNQRGISADKANALFQQNVEKKKTEELEKKLAREKVLDEERNRAKAAEQEREIEVNEEHETPVKIGKKRVSTIGDKRLTRPKILLPSTKSKKNKDTSPDNKPKSLKAERSKLLRELAVKEQAEIVANKDATKIYNVKKPSTLVMKHTKTNRGAKLAEEMEKNINVKPSTSTAAPMLPDISSLPRIPKKSATATSKEPPSATVTSSSTQKLTLPPESANTVPVVSSSRRISASVTKQPVNERYETNLRHPSTSSNSIQPFPFTRLKSCIRRKSLLKIKKSVRFNDRQLATTKVFQVADNASMHGVGNSKDFPIPKNPNSSHQVAYRNLENIHDICRWNPLWLTEQMQKNTKRPPPVCGTSPHIPMLSRFISHEDYVKVVRPLMMLNLWANIQSKYEPNNPEKQLHIGVDRVEEHHIYLKGKVMSRFHCQALLTYTEGKRSLHPKEGDLVALEVALEEDPLTGEAKIVRGQQKWSVTTNDSPQTHRCRMSLFAYVESFKKRKYYRNSTNKVHVGLLESVHDPSFIVNMILVLRARPFILRLTKLLRLTRESHIRTALRTFEAMTMLEHSPLCKIILNPKLADFALPRVDTTSYKPTNPKGKLNDLQTEVVLKVNKVCLSNRPKICLIQGPPGTGKSHMIVNLILKLLDGLGLHKRILLCAPSNAAVDEIVVRLLDIRKGLPKKNRFNMVRCGLESALDEKVQSVSLDVLAKANIQTKKVLSPEQMDSVTLELNALQAKKARKLLELESVLQRSGSIIGTPEEKKSSHKIKEQISLIEININKLMCGTNIESSSNDELEHARKQILQKAHIVAVTLTSCVNRIMEKAFLFNSSEEPFSCCIVDEASQCTEPESLLPLLLGIKVLVLVGDSLQLPATTHCKVAKDLGYSESLLTRLEKCFSDEPVNPAVMLTEQYRMHPEILRWPNSYFYGNRLRSLPGMDTYRTCPLKPYVILSHSHTQENNKIFSNRKEAVLVCNLARCLKESVLVPHNRTLGIITPYTKQRDMISRMLQDEDIKVNTIDGFQGQERDIILISCVRTSGTGFMADAQRLNVALTRAKCSLIICANFVSLMKEPMWKEMLNDGILRNLKTNIPLNSNDQMVMQLVSK